MYSFHLGCRATGAPEGKTIVPDGIKRDVILVGYARSRHCDQVGHQNDPQHRPKGNEGVDDIDDDDDEEDTLEEPGCLCYLLRYGGAIVGIPKHGICHAIFPLYRLLQPYSGGKRMLGCL